MKKAKLSVITFDLVFFMSFMLYFVYKTYEMVILK